MKQNDFTTTLVVDQTPKQVFNAITNPQLWWPGEINGSSHHLNDEFTYRYKEFHFSRQRVIDLVPDQKLVWLVTESIINYVDDKKEWTGMKMIFEISVRNKKTHLSFTHQGLAPEVECYDSCSNSWTQIIQQSLLNLITTGKGIELLLA